MPEAVKLDSWKAIAVHLGRDVRTVQRWEKGEGLPVYRLGHGKAGTVYAFAHELDAWVEARTRASAGAARREASAGEERPAGRRRSGRWLAAAGAGAIAAAGWWLWRAGAPAAATSAAEVPHRYFIGNGRRAALAGEPESLVLASGGRELYVALPAVHAVAVLDAATLRMLGTVALANRPSDLLASADGGRVYVGSTDGGGLDVIETRTRKVTWVAHDPGVSGMALTSDGRYLYLAERYDGLARLDTRSLAVEHIAALPCPVSLALAPGARLLYVGFQCGGPSGRPGHDVIGVFDMAAERFEGTIGGVEPMVATAIAVSPDGSQLWAGSGDACTAAAYDHKGCAPGDPPLVYVYDTANRRLLRRLELGGPTSVSEIRFFAGGRRVLLNGQVADATRLAVLERYPATAAGVAASADNRRVYLALPGAHAVAALEGENCAPPSANLVAWWPGDGSTADAQGLLEGRASAGVRYAPAWVGQGWVFAGPDDTVDFGHDAALEMPWRQGFSLAAWVEWGGGRGGTIARRGEFELALDDRHRLRACFAAGADCATAPVALAADTWHAVAVTADGSGRMALWVDGAAVARAALPGRMTRAGDLVVGGGFEGMLDEIEVYEQALDAGTVRALAAGCR